MSVSQMKLMFALMRKTPLERFPREFSHLTKGYAIPELRQALGKSKTVEDTRAVIEYRRKGFAYLKKEYEKLGYKFHAKCVTKSAQIVLTL